MATFHNICLLFCLLKVFKFRHKWTHSCRTVLGHSEKKFKVITFWGDIMSDQLNGTASLTHRN